MPAQKSLDWVIGTLETHIENEAQYRETVSKALDRVHDRIDKLQFWMMVTAVSVAISMGLLTMESLVGLMK